MADAAAQKAPWDNTPSYGPQDWMDQLAGGAWSSMSLGRKKAPAARTMTPMNLGAPPGLGLMPVQAAKKSVTTVKNRFRVFSEGECACCKPAATDGKEAEHIENEIGCASEPSPKAEVPGLGIKSQSEIKRINAEIRLRKGRRITSEKQRRNE